MTAPEAAVGAPRILHLPEIRRALAGFDPIPAMEAAFRAYSEGRSVVPPTGELLFDEPPGDAHIKFGYIRGGSHFLVKVAAGFYENARRGLPSSTGAVLLFDQKTGLPAAVLLDEGWLTNLRTAAAGAVAAKYLAPRRVEAIGMLGAGVQARLQVELLRHVTPCRNLVVWGRSAAGLTAYREAMTGAGYSVTVVQEPDDVARHANLIVTATPTTVPLLRAGALRPGTHITAIGADTAGKNELEPAVLARADLVVGDSLAQCLERGEIHQALKAAAISADKPIELGHVIIEPGKGRRSDDEITVADLTGVAVQDIMIAEAVLQAVGHHVTI